MRISRMKFRTFFAIFVSRPTTHSALGLLVMPIKCLYYLSPGSTPLCIYALPQRVLRRFGLKTGVDFAHFGLESGMVFEGTTGVYERIYCFSSKLSQIHRVRKKRNMRIRMDFQIQSFLLLF